MGGFTQQCRRRVIVLECEDAEKWKSFTEKMWRTVLQESPDEDWTVYQCHQGKFPSVTDVRERCDVLILPGSHYGSNDDLPWVHRLAELLPQYLAQPTRPRVVACCFGCQILARALGGVVGHNPSGRYVLRVENVRLLQPGGASDGEALPSPGAPGRTGDGPLVLGPGATLRMVESHGDQVLVLPPGATHLATSGTTKHEMWAMGANALAFQFHPEISPQLAHNKIWSAHSTAGSMTPEEVQASLTSLLAGGTDAASFQALLRRYVAGGLGAIPEFGALTHLCAGPEEAGGAPSGVPAVAAVAPALNAGAAKAGAAANTGHPSFQPAFAGAVAAAAVVGPGASQPPPAVAAEPPPPGAGPLLPPVSVGAPRSPTPGAPRPLTPLSPATSTASQLSLVSSLRISGGGGGSPRTPHQAREVGPGFQALARQRQQEDRRQLLDEHVAKASAAAAAGGA